MAVEMQTPVEGQGLAVDIGALYDETLPHIYGYILVRVGGDVVTAEDLTQEVFLALAQQLRDGQEPPAPLPWLYRVARNRVIDHYRRQERTTARFAVWSDEAEHVAEPIGVIDLVPDREWVRAALAELPPFQRLAVILRYVDGLTVAEIAEALGRSEHAVESLLARGRTALRSLLRDPEETP